MLKRKWFLYITEFFAGMSVMAIELGASRLLAPYFSSSQIVWTIIIGAIMIAMALGNVWGGRMADKNPDPDRLYLRLLIVAVWVAAIPFAGKYIIVMKKNKQSKKESITRKTGVPAKGRYIWIRQ